MSITASQGSQGNGLMMQSSSSFRQFEGTNGIYGGNSAPQIYSAVYSTIDVYEMEVNGIAVMRRRKDSWLNATQILKVAGIEKGKRTKVLEKEILIGEHEKVQGGYGKYQGTWIKFERGLEFCKQYGVEELLRPLLTYDMGQDGGVAGSGVIDTPTKEQAMAAQRKRFYNSSVESRPSTQTGTFFKNISSTASHAVAAINKARFDSPGPRSRNSNASRLKSLEKQRLHQQLSSHETSISDVGGAHDQSVQSLNSTMNFNSSQDTLGYANSFAGSDRDDIKTEFDEPPKKRARTSLSAACSQSILHDENIHTSLRNDSPTEPNDSFSQQTQIFQHVNNFSTPLPPLKVNINSQTNAKKDLLMSLFTNYTQVDYSKHQAFLSLSPEDLDIPIDGSSNTALIWAATLARVELLKNLIAHGASVFRVNSTGETALMRSCLVTNNLEMGSFPKILELLGATIEMRDSKGRTVLHHIAIASAVKGRSQASKYYLESLLEFVVRGSGAPFNQRSLLETRQISKSIGIGRFMSEIVNMQDSSGDTALMIASRIGNRSIISQLIEVGADISIPNRSHLTPADFGVGDGLELEIRNNDHTQSNLPGADPKETSKEIISSITNLLTNTQAEFNSEISKKQAVIDELHSKLRVESGILGQRRRLYESLQLEHHDIDTHNLKINNLTRACDEERSRISQMEQDKFELDHESLMQPGDADIPYNLPEKTSILLRNMDPKPETVITDGERETLESSLPEINVLRARINAYKAINDSLANSVCDLKGKDSELTRKYRKIISLCTGVDENRVEENIDCLVRSLESEHDDVELGRVRKFLSKVEGV